MASVANLGQGWLRACVLACAAAFVRAGETTARAEALGCDGVGGSQACGGDHSHSLVQRRGDFPERFGHHSLQHERHAVRAKPQLLLDGVPNSSVYEQVRIAASEPLCCRPHFARAASTW